MKPGDNTLLIYILLSREEKSPELEEQPTGYHTIRWDDSNSASRIYFYSLQARIHPKSQDATPKIACAINVGYDTQFRRTKTHKNESSR